MFEPLGYWRLCCVINLYLYIVIVYYFHKSQHHRGATCSKHPASIETSKNGWLISCTFVLQISIQNWTSNYSKNYKSKTYFCTFECARWWNHFLMFRFCETFVSRFFDFLNFPFVCYQVYKVCSYSYGNGKTKIRTKQQTQRSEHFYSSSYSRWPNCKIYFS